MAQYKKRDNLLPAPGFFSPYPMPPSLPIPPPFFRRRSWPDRRSRHVYTPFVCCLPDRRSAFAGLIAVEESGGSPCWPSSRSSATPPICSSTWGSRSQPPRAAVRPSPRSGIGRPTLRTVPNPESFVMVKRTAGEKDHDEEPLGGHGGMNVVGVASPTKLNKTSFLRRPLSDCTNIVSKELATKREKKSEKKRQYRGRLKAELENSVPDGELAAKRKKKAERKRQYRARKKAELENFVSPSIRSTVTNPTMVLGAIHKPCTMNNQTGSNQTMIAADTQATCDAVEVGNCDPVDVDDESWLHRNNDWRPSPSDGLQNVDNIECVTVDRVGINESQRAKWRDSTQRYRKRKQEQQNSANLASASELKRSRLQSANATLTDEIHEPSVIDLTLTYSPNATMMPDYTHGCKRHSDPTH
ncbi:hypothetical protein EJB05_27567, partial [Eragrostis curvula]